MVYNMSQISSSTGLVTFMQSINNELMRDLLGTMFILVIFFICLMAFYQSTLNTGKSICAASFVCFILSLLLLAIDLVPMLVIYVTLIATGGSLAFIWKD